MKTFKHIPILFLGCVMLLFFSTKTLFADDYYWVGGTGLWSDINHWATSSGGSVLHSQVPTANDDVFFDANSFNQEGQTVTVNLKNAVCKTMDWSNVTNNPILTGDDTTYLRIFGSLIFTGGMTQNYMGQINFEATSGQYIIKSAGHKFLNNVNFEGEGGEWVLQDDFFCDETVSFKNGTFRTNGKLFHCNEFNSTTTSLRKLFLSSSVIDVNFWNVYGEQLELHALSANFQIGSNMSNSFGGPLKYPDIHFNAMGASLQNDSIIISFNDVIFAGSGSINGNCNIHDVYINGFGSISGTDTIHFITFTDTSSLNGGRNVVDKITFLSHGIVRGFNKIKKIISNGMLEVKNANIIDTALCDKGVIINGNNTFHYLKVIDEAFIYDDNDFYRADFLGDALFKGNNSFNFLNFFPGYTYKFGINSTQTISNEWSINGSCNKPIRMFADTLGVQAIVKVTGNAVNGQYLSLRDMKAAGNTPFIAAHSVDLGNNSGWNIETTGGVDLYWVNGSGNWTDNNHWATSSGGAGGHCPPTEIDNAIFDAASFPSAGNTVTLDAENGVCNDMIWKTGVNSPRFFGPENDNIHIYGSLTETASLNWQIHGETFFEAVTPGKTITTAEHPFLNTVWFDGRNGSWNLKDKFESFLTINLWHGTLNTEGNKVDCFNFESSDTTTRGLNLDTTHWTMNSFFVPAWRLCGINLSLSADSSWLFSTGINGHIINFNSFKPMVFNNVNLEGAGSMLINSNAYCYYNVVSHSGMTGEITGNCSIDSALFFARFGKISSSDSINVAIFYKKSGLIKGGQHNVKYALFVEDGYVRGNNKIDTAIFLQNGYVYDTNSIDTLSIHNNAIIEGENNVRTALLLGNGKFYGNNTFNDIVLSKSFSYYLENGKTQTVVDNLNINGSCTGPIFIQSDENTKQSVIKKINGTITGEYVQLRDIKGEGQGVPFTAYNSVDLGNNTNWNIYVSSPKELYWVNGEGNWSDSLHWSGTSGGQGGYCIPTPIDNVYFDENSFFDVNDSVIIDIGNATCHNMDWTGAQFQPVFYCPDTNFMRIYGGVKWNENMNLKLYGPLFFESTHGNNHILSRGKRLTDSVYFQGIGGEWIFDDAFYSTNDVFFVHGIINTQGNDFTVGALKSNYNNERELIVKNSHVYFLKSITEVWFINGLNFTYDGANTVFEVNGNTAVFRTDYGGPFHYHYIVFNRSGGRIYNKNTNVSIDSVLYEEGGEIHGDCSITTVRSKGNTGVYNSDKINLITVNNGNLLLQGNHNVNTVIANSSCTVSGSNTVDSVWIGGAGELSGTNNITKAIIFGDVATISGTNYAHYALLKNNGTFNGENSFDSLKFMPGNIYELEENKTQTINKDFLIRGNNCFPITLRSLQDGMQAYISMPQGRTVSGDFIEIKDINATGGAVYYAGQYSTDLSNNNGWIFENAPGYIFGFTDDTVACLGGDMIIGTDNFNPDDQSTFLWQDGSTNPYFQLTGEDTIWVTVNYASNCSYTDTLAIHYKDSPTVDLGNDKTMCSGDTVSISYHSDSVTYLWNNGSTDSVITVNQAGYYSITVTNPAGCKASDTIYINAIPSPVVDLGPDTTIFSDQNYLLDAGNQGAKYIWSTGDTTQTISVNTEGQYWVAVMQDGCRGYDTITVYIYPDCILAVPNAFSPNGDGHNDILYARGEGFTEMELMIFNRIGEMVFDTKDNSIGWDGTFKGENQPVDTYVYILKGKCVSGRTIFKKGNITLLR
jgi:gliding motility-associated-like protein